MGHPGMQTVHEPGSVFRSCAPKKDCPACAACAASLSERFDSTAHHLDSWYVMSPTMSSLMLPEARHLVQCVRVRGGSGCQTHVCQAQLQQVVSGWGRGGGGSYTNERMNPVSMAML